MNTNTMVTVQEVTDFISEKVGQKVKPLESSVKGDTLEHSVTIFVPENSPVESFSVDGEEELFLTAKAGGKVDSEVYFALMFEDDFGGETASDLVDYGQLCISTDGIPFDAIESV